jgi:hypothetical protein
LPEKMFLMSLRAERAFGCSGFWDAWGGGGP